MRPTLLPASLALALLATGCASNRPRPAGVTIERGMASWYGPGFHGRRTASGERYDMNEVSAAHPSLPFGTIVEVRNLDNGRSVRVRINDRGPFLKNRIIDLSKGAAKAIGMLGPGIALVELAAVGRVPIGPRGYAIQVGAFQEESRARAVADALCRDYPQVEVRSDDAWHRVQVGSFPDRAAADDFADELTALGYTAVVVPLPLDAPR